MAQLKEIRCDKDGEEMQQISVGEISGDVGNPRGVFLPEVWSGQDDS